MKQIKFSVIILLTSLGINGVTEFKNYVDMDEVKISNTMNNKKSFAVLELFTSEGCSSCPPADDLMAKIQNEYKDEPVYLLAFHVDYWDRQGWKDAFSSPDYSNRQTEYENWFKIGSLYTPQLVINGKAEFIGSEESKIRRAINMALAIESETELSVQSVRNDVKLTLNYEVIDKPRDSRLLVAIIQKLAKTNVERGENKGRLLSHVQIVRSLHSEPLNKKGKGSATVMLPEGFNSNEWEVLAMIQNLNTGAIATVTRVVL